MDNGAGGAQPAARRPHLTAPPRKSSCVGTSWVMMADILGTSVLTFAGVARQLGWVLTIAFIILSSVMATYTAVLMSWTRNRMVQMTGREPLTMGEAGRMLLGGDKAAAVVYSIVYGYGYLGQSAYLLVLGQAMQGIFYESGICLPLAILITSGMCLPFVIAVRNLYQSVLLCFINFLLMLAVLAIVMAQQAMDGRQDGVMTFTFAEDLSFSTVFGGMTNILYSCCGHWIYFEMISEMAEPEKFPRVLLMNTPLQVGVSLLVACWGYYFAGNQAKGYFLDNLPSGMAYRWASALLLPHVLVAFLVKSVVLSRHLHALVSPVRAAIQPGEAGCWRAHFEYACCGVLLLFSGFFLANAVPFFMELMGLIGGLICGPISLLFPMIFFAKAEALCLSRPATQSSELAARGLDRPKGEPLLADIPSDSQRGSGSGDRSSWQSLSCLNRILFLVTGTVTMLTLVVGTADNLSRIASNLEEHLPFSCKALARQAR